MRDVEPCPPLLVSGRDCAGTAPLTDRTLGGYSTAGKVEESKAAIVRHCLKDNLRPCLQNICRRGRGRDGRRDSDCFRHQFSPRAQSLLPYGQISDPDACVKNPARVGFFHFRVLRVDPTSLASRSSSERVQWTTTPPSKQSTDWSRSTPSVMRCRDPARASIVTLSAGTFPSRTRSEDRHAGPSRLFAPR